MAASFYVDSYSTVTVTWTLVVTTFAVAPDPEVPITRIVYVPGFVPRSVQAPHPLKVAIPQRAIKATSNPLVARRRLPGINITSNAATVVPANCKPVVDPELATWHA